MLDDSYLTSLSNFSYHVRIRGGGTDPGGHALADSRIDLTSAGSGKAITLTGVLTNTNMVEPLDFSTQKSSGSAIDTLRSRFDLISGEIARQGASEQRLFTAMQNIYSQFTPGLSCGSQPYRFGRYR